jgi:hypothetical protein
MQGESLNRTDIAADTEEYLKKGGKISVIPIGTISDMWRTKSEIAAKNGVSSNKGRKGTTNKKQMFHLTNEE